MIFLSQKGEYKITKDSKFISILTFPIFWVMVICIFSSLFIFYLIFNEVIQEQLTLPLFSIGLSLFIFGLILLGSVLFYYSFLTDRFANDMQKIRNNIDKIVKTIENDGNNNSLFKFNKLKIKFKLPFMEIETEAVRNREYKNRKIK